MSTQDSPAVACLVCGEVTRTKDRRNLNSRASKHVLSGLKEITRELEKREHHTDFNVLISGYGDPAGVGYMCRGAFT